MCYWFPDASKSECDHEFYDNMIKICDVSDYSSCSWYAKAMYQAPNWGGQSYYDAGQEQGIAFVSVLSKYVYPSSRSCSIFAGDAFCDSALMPAVDMHLEDTLLFLAVAGLVLTALVCANLACVAVWLKRKWNAAAIKKAGWNKLEWWMSTDDEQESINQIKEEER